MIIGRLVSMKNELVSVILPVYNAEKHLEETITSVLEQTYKNLEIIIIDDCSTDNTKSIINDFQKNHVEIKYIRQVENMGVAVARNTGIKASTGRYIAFIDSDDLWKKTKIEKQLNEIVNGSGFSFTSIEIIDVNSSILKSKRKINKQVTYKKLLRNTQIATSSVLLDRKRIQNIKMPNLRSGQDYACWLQILRGGKIAYGIDEALVSYRITANSLSKNKFKSLKQVWQIQSRYENIPVLNRILNVIFFVINNVKKKFF